MSIWLLKQYVNNDKNNFTENRTVHIVYQHRTVFSGLDCCGTDGYNLLTYTI